MRIALLVACMLLAFYSEAQIISTIAGNGIMSNSGDGSSATLATIDFPTGGAFDKNGNYYFGTGSHGSTIRKITPSGMITTVAGMTGVSGNSGDGGMATNAKLNNPQGLAFDSAGNLFIVDEGNENVRKVSATTGIITTIAGNGIGSYGGDGGPATNAMFWGAQDICLDKRNNIYICDYQNNRIRRIDALGIISTFAGTGSGVYNGDGGRADTSAIKAPTGICMDHIGNLYIAESSGLRIRRVDTFGIMTTVVGNGTFGISGDNGPAIDAQTHPFKVAVDNFGDLFINEEYISIIRVVNNSGIIKTFVGNGIDGYAGDGGPASSAQIFTRTGAGMALDSCGNLFIGDVNNYRIRKITFPHCHYLETILVDNSKSNVYPNPVSSVLHIDNSGGRFEISDLVGKRVAHGILRSGKNDISLYTLANGIYILILEDNEGKRTITKFVKQ